MSELSPCPFCGSSNLQATCEHVKCLDCGAFGPTMGVEAWNDRATPWNYPPEMPEEGQDVLLYFYSEISCGEDIYACRWGTEPSRIRRQMRRWIPAPAADTRTPINSTEGASVS